ncbi:hypothetical protein RJT34_22806 [Clitoria ternatea]|uniref:Uncharacterized protein n=1 Tax=Clitoria ternatea TaxID=43366 RepID=A0AAN9FLC7_CLITE
MYQIPNTNRNLIISHGLPLPTNLNHTISSKKLEDPHVPFLILFIFSARNKRQKTEQKKYTKGRKKMASKSKYSEEKLMKNG